MPLLAAGWLNTESLTADIAGRATQAIAGTDAASWAKLEVDHRDVRLSGTSPSQEAVDKAVAAVAGTYGVRTVVNAAQVVVPVALLAPTIESLNDSSGTPVIKGTWQEGVAKTLAVTLNNKTYKLGESPELTSSAGNWQLKLAEALPEGSYEIAAEVSDGTTTLKSEQPGKLVVDLPDPPPPPAPPAAPTISAAAAVSGAAPQISGTWDAADGNSLTAKLADSVYELGKGPELTAPAAGSFVFVPPASTAPGEYDVQFITKAANGLESTASAKLVIPAPAPTPAQAEPAAAQPEPAAAQPEQAAAPTNPPANPPVSPTVDKLTDLTGAPIIKGTWPEGNGNTLSVSLGGRTYELGKDANLQSKEGKWSLLPGAALKDGIYDIVAKVTSPDGQTAQDTSVGDIEVAATQPAAPSVAALAVGAAADSFSGTWDEKAAKSLAVSIPEANLSAKLGEANSPLSSDGSGNWALKLPAPLAPGDYTINVQTTDAHGRVQDASGKVSIAAPEPAAAQPEQPVAEQPAAEQPAQPQTPPLDCAAELARIATEHPIRFRFNHTGLSEPYSEAVAQYASLLKDPRCADIKVEIAGHADYFGPRAYNKWLSGLRAEAIQAQLAAAGIDASRLSLKAFSEDMPLDPQRSIEARQKNRRVEITVLK